MCFASKNAMRWSLAHISTYRYFRKVSRFTRKLKQASRRKCPKQRACGIDFGLHLLTTKSDKASMSLDSLSVTLHGLSLTPLPANPGNASLSSLPSELDKDIAKLLSTSDLHSLTGVSRHYNNIAEPYLYRHVGFFNDGHEFMMGRLFLTILGRPSLARHIESFTLSVGTFHQSLQNHLTSKIRLQGDFDETSKSIFDMVDAIGEHFKTPGYKERCIQSLRTLTTSKPTCDAVLVRILYIATNLESILLCCPLNSDFELSLMALRMRCTQELRSDKAFPLCKLKMFILKGA
ncbi:hypothetical protein BDV95DRAFT_576609 [Massariosphaeria phaeospora]|uniref:F-box domain-containing protein n=1 Tax=Massariosphaeria phaeospora TaxID=100035 RepID=A0A7C8I5P4_9PLEO|nr:hypothetical protein BDV95DRAFT_576609 [Massariosphaeria phaeospora]